MNYYDFFLPVPLIVFFGIYTVIAARKSRIMSGSFPKLPEFPYDDLHDFEDFSSTKEIFASKKENASAPGEAFSVLVPFILTFSSFIVWIALLYLTGPSFLSQFVNSQQTPKNLLAGYIHWYEILIAAAKLGILFGAVSLFAFFWKGIKNLLSFLLIGLSLFVTFLMCGWILTFEDVPLLLSQAKEDLAQIESGQLKQAVVWFSPKSRSARLPGPYTDGQAEPLTRYGGIGVDTDGVWVHFYVPEGLGFSLNPDALYDETESVSWNEEHAEQYQISYTENFHIVVSAEPADGCSD